MLYGYVQLLKNIYNLWLTEKTGELIFDGIKRVAKWAHLKQLYCFEYERQTKLSDLNEISIALKPIERQEVSTCLRVFPEKIYLLTQSGISADKNDTALLKNAKLTNDPLQAEIRSPNDNRLGFINEFGKIALNMAGSQGNHKKQLSQNTATAIHHTCNGIVSLCQHHLAISHRYVLLGQFLTDPLEKKFGKLCQGSGGIYFINVQ